MKKGSFENEKCQIGTRVLLLLSTLVMKDLSMYTDLLYS